MTKGDIGSAAEMASSNFDWMSTPDVARQTRAAVTAMATGDAGALAAARNLSELLGMTRQQTIIDRLTLARRVPPNVAMPAISGDLASHVIGEGGPKPLSKFSMQTVTVSPVKISAAFVVTNDLLRISSVDAETDLGNQAVRELSLQTDRVFADRSYPGSIATGATSIASTGSTIAAIDSDLRSLLSLFSTSDAAQLIFAMSTNAAVYLASLRGSGGAPAFPNITRNGGSIWGVPVLTSGALTASGSPGESQLLLFDQSKILVADENQAEISIAKSASVQLVDNPTDPVTSNVSLFQSNLIGILVERYVGWGRVSASSVGVLTDVQFG